jgi:hypothetical protein
MSPTVLRARGLRFYFFSREEQRPHVHVQASRGEAKFWLEPKVELAANHKMSQRSLDLALRLVNENKHEILAAWRKHFRG